MTSDAAPGYLSAHDCRLADLIGQDQIAADVAASGYARSSRAERPRSGQ